MYQQFYQFEMSPFENTPDSRYFYASEQHREALAAIEYVIRLRKGFVLITGPIGAGKTTIGRTMCERCGDMATIIHLMHGHESGQELTKQVLRAMGLPVRRNEDHGRTLERLRDTVMERLYRGKPVVLMVDEAQTLCEDAIEELRLLSNFDTATQKPVQVVLIGQPELRHKLRLPQFDALRQRIFLAKELAPLSRADTGHYIAHRLKTASLDKDNVQVTFSDAAIREIYEYTNGIPRMINSVCDNCLLLGFVKQSHQITPSMVRRVLSDLLPSYVDSTQRAAVANTESALEGSI